MGKSLSRVFTIKRRNRENRMTQDMTQRIDETQMLMVERILLSRLHHFEKLLLDIYYDGSNFLLRNVNNFKLVIRASYHIKADNGTL